MKGNVAVIGYKKVEDRPFDKVKKDYPEDQLFQDIIAERCKVINLNNKNNITDTTKAIQGYDPKNWSDSTIWLKQIFYYIYYHKANPNLKNYEITFKDFNVEQVLGVPNCTVEQVLRDKFIGDPSKEGSSKGDSLWCLLEKQLLQEEILYGSSFKYPIDKSEDVELLVDEMELVEYFFRDFTIADNEDYKESPSTIADNEDYNDSNDTGSVQDNTHEVTETGQDSLLSNCIIL